MKNYPYPKIIAHRGAGKDAPENTLVAFRLGAEHGYTMFECDVKFSKDRELFLHHDDDLDRTTDGKGLAKLYMWDELSKRDAGSWHSPKYAGEALARFEQLVDFVLANHFQLDVEIKPNPDEAYETGVAVAKFLATKISLDHTPYPFLLSSFQPEALKGAKDTVPNMPRALLVDSWGNDEDKFMAILDELACVGIITNFRILTEEIVKRCHDTGRFVMIYTANEPKDIERLFAMGVDSVITDNMHYLKTNPIYGIAGALMK